MISGCYGMIWMRYLDGIGALSRMGVEESARYEVAIMGSIVEESD